MADEDPVVEALRAEIGNPLRAIVAEAERDPLPGTMFAWNAHRALRAFDRIERRTEATAARVRGLEELAREFIGSPIPVDTGRNWDTWYAGFRLRIIAALDHPGKDEG